MHQWNIIQSRNRPTHIYALDFFFLQKCQGYSMWYLNCQKEHTVCLYLLANQIIVTEIRTVVACEGQWVGAFWSEEMVLYLRVVFIFIKTHWTVYLRYTAFHWYKIYFHHKNARKQSMFQPLWKTMLSPNR